MLSAKGLHFLNSIIQKVNHQEFVNKSLFYQECNYFQLGIYRQNFENK